MSGFLNRPVLIIVIFIALVAGVFLANNPNLLPTSLLQREIKITPSKTSPKPASLQQGPFKCPSIVDFCQKGGEVKAEDPFGGFGAIVAVGSPIFAAFDGTVTTVTSTLSAQFNNEKITTIYLDNEERGLRAVYYSRGEATNPNPEVVKEGDKIGTIGPIMTYYRASLVFLVVANYPDGEKLTLTSQDFK